MILTNNYNLLLIIVNLQSCIIIFSLHNRETSLKRDMGKEEHFAIKRLLQNYLVVSRIQKLIYFTYF